MTVSRLTLTRPLALAVAVALGAGALLAGCGGDDGDAASTPATTEATTAPEPAPEPEPAPAPPPPRAEPGLPPITAGYEDFTRLNAQPIPPSPAAPHGDTKNVYVNQPRERIAPGGTPRYPYPDGTVVVKSGSGGGDDARIVAVMRKVAGLDPAHGDWEYIEYSRPDPSSPYTVLARDAVCWGCHAGATDTDWVYTTLQ
jgi:hypothetical protein